MRRLKKIIRVMALVIFIALASLGVGISGGVPIMHNNRRKLQNLVNTEKVEVREEKENEEDFKMG
jgi:hypothetical protein